MPGRITAPPGAETPRGEAEGESKKGGHPPSGSNLGNGKSEK